MSDQAYLERGGWRRAGSRERKGSRAGVGERGTDTHNNENNNKQENAEKTNPHANNYGTAIETTCTDESTLFLTNIVLL